MRAFILEDNADRCSTMAAVLADMFPRLEPEFFATAQNIIDRIKAAGTFDVAFIALDNDLEMVRAADGRLTDAGDGIEVAKFLANHPPIVPVIVHTTNTVAGDKIVEHLVSAHWDVTRVVPYGNLQWISEEWRAIVRDRFVQCTPPCSLSELGTRIIRTVLSSHNYEYCLHELLRATVYAACNRLDAGDLHLEFAVLDQETVFRSSLDKGVSLLDHRALRDRLISITRENGRSRPLTLSTSDTIFEPDERNLLAEIGVAQIRVELFESVPNRPALFLAASCRAEIDLFGLKIENILKEGRVLLDVALLSMSRHVPDQPIVYSETGTPSTWPSTVRETKE